MNNKRDRMDCVASQAEVTLLVTIAAVGALVVLVIAASQGRLSDQELHWAGTLALAMIGAMLLVPFALSLQVLLTLFTPLPTSAAKAADRAIAQRQHELEADVARRVAEARHAEPRR